MRWQDLVVVGVVVAAGCGRSGVISFADEYADAWPTEDPIVDRCDAVDYLFVIDNSASMADNQRKLIDNYATFIDEVERSLETVDSLHVGVITTDIYQGNTPECRRLGGLVVSTAGQSSSNEECGPYADGFNFMTEEDDLQDAFACAAQVGISGSIQEAPLTAASLAIDGMLTEEGECNEGFIRDDALLVVVVLTDEDEPEAGARLSEAMTNAKLGYRDNAVLVAIVNEVGGPCGAEGKAALETIALAKSLEHGFVGSICEADFSPAFARAVDVVKEACGQ